MQVIEVESIEQIWNGKDVFYIDTPSHIISTITWEPKIILTILMKGEFDQYNEEMQEICKLNSKWKHKMISTQYYSIGLCTDQDINEIKVTIMYPRIYLYNNNGEKMPRFCK